MAGPTVRVHDGMTLDALAAAVRSADIRLCLTVTEHFGWNGLGDTIAFRMLPLHTVFYCACTAHHVARACVRCRVICVLYCVHA